MSLNSNDNANSFIIYRTHYEALMEDFTPEQVYEFIRITGDYMLNGNRDVKSPDKMVNAFFKGVRGSLDAAEKRHRQAVENGKKGAEYGRLGGAKEGNQNARKKQPQNDPQSTPKQPLETEIENEIEKEIKIKNEIEKDRGVVSCYSICNDFNSNYIDNNKDYSTNTNTNAGHETERAVEVSTIGEAIQTALTNDLRKLVSLRKGNDVGEAYYRILQRAEGNYAAFFGIDRAKAKNEVDMLLKDALKG